LLLTDCQEKIRKHSTSAFKENSAGILLNFDFNRQSSCKNSNRDFGRQSAGKFFAFNGQSSSKKLKWFFWWAGGWQINFVFNGQSSSKKSKHPFCGQAVGNILNCFFLTDIRPEKFQISLLGGRWPAKIF
jgi:hypothetical protein